MREYKEIVDDLRWRLLEVPYSLLQEAADAIEQLQADLKEAQNDKRRTD
jgi:hypothetical protein